MRTITVEPHVFSCISQLARALGIQLASKIDNLLDQMLSVGLSSGLTDALRVIAMHIPTLRKNIQGTVPIQFWYTFFIVCTLRWSVTDAVIDTDAPTTEASWGSQRTNSFKYEAT